MPRPRIKSDGMKVRGSSPGGSSGSSGSTGTDVRPCRCAGGQDDVSSQATPSKHKQRDMICKYGALDVIKLALLGFRHPPEWGAWCYQTVSLACSWPSGVCIGIGRRDKSFSLSAGRLWCSLLGPFLPRAPGAEMIQQLTKSLNLQIRFGSS